MEGAWLSSALPSQSHTKKINNTFFLNLLKLSFKGIDVFLNLGFLQDPHGRWRLERAH